MASKKAATRKASDKRREVEELRKLTKKVRDEVAKLLAHEQAGTVTPEQLETGLAEVEHRLTRMMVFLNKLL